MLAKLSGSPRRLVLLCGSVLLLAVGVLGGGVAVAQFTGQAASPIIYACVSKPGNVRVVTEGTACRPDETAISWNAQGPQGPQGQQGPQGDPGPQGPQGAPGDVNVHVNLDQLTTQSPTVAMYLQIQGLRGGDILGTSTDPTHLHWINVLSYQSGVSNPGTPTTSGKVTFEPFSVTKQLDKASPQLSEAAALGRAYTVTLQVCSLGAKEICFMQYTLENARVTAVQDGSGGQNPTESVTFSYGQVKWQYLQQNPDGSTTPFGGGWDLQTNTAS